MHPWVRAAVPACLLIAGSSAHADTEPIEIAGRTFESWQHYTSSEFFQENGHRCATLPSGEFSQSAAGSAADCAFNSTNPTSDYDPGVTFVIDVVVHVIANDSGTQGNISDADVQSGIDIGTLVDVVRSVLLRFVRSHLNKLAFRHPTSSHILVNEDVTFFSKPL